MPEQSYRETISRTVEVEFTHKRLIGGGGEFANVKIRLEPLPRGTGVEFVNDVRNGCVPDQMIGGVEEGIREAAKAGVLNGGTVVDFRVTLTDGKYHEIDSNWRTFSLAAQSAFWDGMRKAGPKLLLR
jgi:elongation factor G